MNTVFKQIKKAYKKIEGFFPTSLPVGVTEFHTWADSIVSTYSLPDNDSSRWALSVMISHLDPTTATKPTRYFARSVRKSMANQIAYSIMEGLKAKQKAEQAAEAAKQLEVTNSEVTSNVSESVQN